METNEIKLQQQQKQLQKLSEEVLRVAASFKKREPIRVIGVDLPQDCLDKLDAWIKRG